MATIRRRGKKWNVQVRRLGFKSRSKTFCQKVDAVRWGRATECEIDKHFLLYGKSNGELDSLGSLLIRYRDEVVVKKRSRKNETIIINAFLRRTPIANIPLDKIEPYHFAQYRDNRLKNVSEVTVARELTVYQNAFKVAIQEQ